VTVYYTEQAGKKVAHFFEKILGGILFPATRS